MNYAIILLCGLSFLAQLNENPQNSLIERFGMIPARVLAPDREVTIKHAVPVRTPFGQIHYEIIERPVAPSAVSGWLTLLTCIFLHGGWMHFIGNMWFLYIFGDNVEDRCGHLGYLLFYLACGVGASAAHLIAGPESTAPTIGASGAIAGVMGAYFLLYPRAKVLAVIPIVFILEMVILPAPVFLGFWFVLQLLQGTLAITTMQSAGVAWWAHIGGFVIGVVIAIALKAGNVTKPPVQQVRPKTERVRIYQVYPRRR